MSDPGASRQRVLTRDEARRYLVASLGLARSRARGAAGIRATLDALTCVQLDPLDVIGTNADLVMLARVDGIAKGDVYRALLPHYAFEHFAKERCLLPARAFPHYRAHALVENGGYAEAGAPREKPLETPWWRLSDRVKRVPERVIEAVYDDIATRGPLGPSELADHGEVEPLDWQGWKGTARMSTMALEILWTRCRIVVAGRSASGEKRYDLPERALPDHHGAPAEPFERWALLERVKAAGLLARAGGPHWSMLRDVRSSTLPDELVEEGVLEEVRIEGSRRPYLALAGLPAPRVRDDGRMRILGPLDPLLWDRALVSHAFGFDYAWEVYKPASARRFGWYVCPLLHEGQLVARIEARVEGGALVLERLWVEEGRALDEDALDAALERHASAMGVDIVRRARRARRRSREA